MGFISWIIVGALAGWIASMIMGKNEQMGGFANIIVGVIGALIGGFITSKFFNLGKPDGINIYSILVSVIGAVILLAIINAVKKNK
ncbi:MAG: GlsB/YeaQ/YmgE family stress response membrane protein [Lagierella massiliensis]|nr:GlsB/YeaQ/YmgE family stress response membrane protein [Lagierella massiliensis]